MGCGHVCCVCQPSLARGLPDADSTAALSPTVAETTYAELLRTLRTKKAIFLGEHHPEPRDHFTFGLTVTVERTRVEKTSLSRFRTDCVV